MTSRFIVGIDLGTTNCALSYIDLEKGLNPKLFAIPQVTALGESSSELNLPSFLYRCEQSESSSLGINWDKKPLQVCGEYARRFGSSRPDRFIHSAKSWLVHGAVDRKQPILPWGIELEKKEKLSPVQASSFYLSHLKNAWNHEFAKEKDQDGSPCILEDQDLIITVPASFDEVARELTLQSAFEAGFKKVTLLEEPLAAFYSWLQEHPDWQNILEVNERILIVDIGGGTSDFSMIQLGDDGVLRRSSVGPHLLLGGDNIDRTLAFEVQKRAERKFTTREMASLVQECRRAKETALNDVNTREINLTIHSGGSSLLKGMSMVKMSRQEIVDIIHRGFFPETAVNAPDPDRKVGLRTLNLPYERDPSIHSHLLAFLRKDAKICGDQKIIFPKYILFNGGTMIPESFRNAIINQINSWSGDQLSELQSRGLDIAVAHGASAYGLSRCGHGTSVKGGIVRSYFMQINTANGDQLLTIMPRDTEEHSTQNCSQIFTLKTNSIVSFPLFSSETRLLDKVGDIIEKDSDEISALAPLSTTISYGKKASHIKVKISTIINESNCLEVWLNSIESKHKWQLRFDLRQIHEQQDQKIENNSVTINEEQLQKTTILIEESFESINKNKLDSLIKNMETTLELNRKEWSITLCRRIADIILNMDLNKLRSNSLTEQRLYNLLGFLMRPGFGDSNDQFRVGKIWPFWFKGPQAQNNPQIASEWWILWRRCSGALTRGRQEQMAHKLLTEISKKSLKPQVLREIKRCLGSLEMSPIKLRKKVLSEFHERATRLDELELWMITRMAARHTIYAPIDLVLPPKSITSLATLIMQTNPKKISNMHLLCISRIMAFTGNSALDLPEKNRVQASDFLKRNNAPERLITQLSELIEENKEDQKTILGDSIPVGLQLN